MRTGFNKFERTAGVFVLAAVVGCVLSIGVVAIKQGWFEGQMQYIARFEHAEGVRPGTAVQISGLRAGSVDEVHLIEDNSIEVKMHVGKSFSSRVKQDSVARIVRPFIIGDKVIDVSVGGKDAVKVADRGILKSEESMDLMDLMGGGKLGPYLNTVTQLAENLRVVAEAFSDPERSKALVGMFDELLPTLKVVQNLGKQLTKKQNVGRAVENLASLTDELNGLLPQMKDVAQKMPSFGENTMATMAELRKLTEELNKFLPILTQISPQLPKATSRGVEALEEAVIVLQAMQKSFLLSGKVEDVKKERAEAERKRQKQEENERSPASEAP